MEDYLFKNKITSNENITSDKGYELYRKKISKKRKIKAHEIQIKDFYSDEEDDSAFKKKFNKYNNKRKIEVKDGYKNNQNSILIYKQLLQKKSTIDQTPRENGRQRFFSDDHISSKNKDKNKISKKVNFAKDNFVKIIEIESYKKYNCDNSNIEPYSEDKKKEESKCCLIC